MKTSRLPWVPFAPPGAVPAGPGAVTPIALVASSPRMTAAMRSMRREG